MEICSNFIVLFICSPSTLSKAVAMQSGKTFSLSNYQNGDILIVSTDGYGWGSSPLVGGGVSLIAITPLVSPTNTWYGFIALVEVTDKNTNMTFNCTSTRAIICKVE